MKTVQMQMELGKVAASPRDWSRDEFIAARLAKSPTGEDRLMESICERDNMLKALQRVESNKGAPGVDRMKTTQLRGYVRRHWDKIKCDLLQGTHKPLPVRRKEIPKPDGGVRLLGIPTVLDRLIQQAVAQILTALWDHTFSEFSYGFRPERSAQMAIEQARQYVEAGYTYVVDIDLSEILLLSSSRTANYAIRTISGVGGTLRKGRSHPVRSYLERASNRTKGIDGSVCLLRLGHAKILDILVVIEFFLQVLKLFVGQNGKSLFSVSFQYTRM